MKKFIALLIAVLLFSVALISCAESDYDKALNLIENEEYEEAYQILKESDDSDAKALLGKFRYVPTNITAITDHGGKTEEAVLKLTLGKNNLPSKTSCSLPDLDDFMTNKYSYDSKGYLTKKVITDNFEDESWSYEYTYNEDGNVVKEVYRGSGDPHVTTYTYDEKGSLIKEEYDGKVINYNITYDANGNKIKEIESGSDGYEYYTTDYTYDEKGNLIKIVSTLIDGYVTTTVYTYDSNDKLIKEVETSGGYETTIEYEYDNHGNVVKTIQSFGNNYKFILVYEYKLVYSDIQISQEEIYEMIVTMVEDCEG